jgi:hypothetical protein
MSDASRRETTAVFWDSLSLLNSFVYCDMRKKEETNKPVKTFPNTQDNAHNRCCYCRVTTINSRRLHCIVLAVVGGKVYNFCQSKKTISNQMKRRERKTFFCHRDRSESNWNTSRPILCFTPAGAVKAISR